ncbi:MAG: oligosaccharide flippase family protein [Clostridia bacterium]|nr:oligosaccharide flippase family protein [Clostridia bacterium]
MKSIFKAVATVTIFSVITRTLGFFFRIFLSRKLGAEGMGLYQMASSVLGIFMTLISSGIPLTTAKLVSKYESQNELVKRNKVVTSALVVALFVAVFSSIFILILKSVWNIVLTDSRAVEILIILIPSIIFSAIYAVFRGALWGKNDYFSCGLTELLEQIIRFALTFIMLLTISDFFVATKYSAIAFNITCLASAIITLFIYLKKGKLNFHKGEYKNVIKSAAPITGVRLANSLVQPLTTLIIPTMLILSGYTTSEAVSSFGVIMGMTFPMLFVPMSIVGSISMVLIPSISSMMSKNDYTSIENNINNSIKVSTFISMLFIPLYLSVGNLIGIVLYDNALSGILLQLSAVCVLPITMCNLTGSILNALNMEVKSFVNYIIGSVVLFVSLIVLTPIIQINSIIVSFFLSMTIISLLNLHKIKKVVPNLNVSLVTTSFKYSLIIAPSSLLGHFISNICLLVFTNFFSAVIGGGFAILSVVILAKIFNLFNFKDLLELLKKKKSKSKN